MGPSQVPEKMGPSTPAPSRPSFSRPSLLGDISLFLSFYPRVPSQSDIAQTRSLSCFSGCFCVCARATFFALRLLTFLLLPRQTAAFLEARRPSGAAASPKPSIDERDKMRRRKKRTRRNRGDATEDSGAEERKT